MITIMTLIMITIKTVIMITIMTVIITVIMITIITIIMTIIMCVFSDHNYFFKLFLPHYWSRNIIFRLIEWQIRCPSIMMFVIEDRKNVLGSKNLF